MKKIILTWVLAVMSIVTLEAQKECGTAGYTEMLIQKNPELEAHINQSFANKIADIKSSNTQNKTANIDVVYIPVVIHLIGGSVTSSLKENNYQRIYDQLRILNEDFRKKQGTNGDGFGDGYTPAVDTNIEFCLANKDEFGRETTGITEIPGNFPTFDYFQENDFAYNSDYTLKHLVHWNEHKYLNIYVIDDNGVKGWASKPENVIFLGGVDGVVIGEPYFGITLDQHNGNGRTLTHEVGHWLGLKHTWGDGSCAVDDGIEDTPWCSGQYWADFYNSCSAPSPNQCVIENDIALLSNRRQVENYMDYSDDLCMNMFTNGQKELMHRTLISDRWQMTASSAELVGCAGPEHCYNNYYEPLDGETDVDCGGECNTCDGSSGGGSGSGSGNSEYDYCYENHLNLELFRGSSTKGNLLVQGHKIYERESCDSYSFAQEMDYLDNPYSIKILNENLYVVLNKGKFLSIYSKNANGIWFKQNEIEINGTLKFTSKNIYILEQKNNGLDILKYSINDNATSLIGHLPIKYEGHIKYMSDSVIYSIKKEGENYLYDTFYEFKTTDNWVTHTNKSIVCNDIEIGINGIYVYNNTLIVMGARPTSIYEEINGNWIHHQKINAYIDDAVFVTNDIFMGIRKNHTYEVIFYKNNGNYFEEINLEHLGGSTIGNVNGSLHPTSLLSNEEIILNRELNEIIVNRRALKISHVLGINSSEIINDITTYKGDSFINEIPTTNSITGYNIIVGDGINELVFENTNKTIKAEKKIIFNSGISFKNSSLSAKITSLEESLYKNCVFTGTCSSTSSKIKKEILKNQEEFKKIDNKEKITEVIYPNPNKGLFFIDNYKNIKSLKLYEITGGLVFEKNLFVNNQVEVPQLKTGMYIVILHMKTGEKLEASLVIQE